MLAGLISQAVMTGASMYSRSRADDVKKEWGLILLSVITGILALIFLTSALYMTLSDIYTPQIGALATGCVMAFFAFGCLFIANRKEKLQLTKKRSALPSVNDNQMLQTVQSVIAEIEQPIKDNPTTAVLLASIAGFLAADRLR